MTLFTYTTQIIGSLMMLSMISRSIQELENTPSKELHISVNDIIEGLDLTEPLTAELAARDLGEFVEITGSVKGNVKLVCDYCLSDFDYKLDFDIDEMYERSGHAAEDR